MTPVIHYKKPGNLMNRDGLRQAQTQHTIHACLEKTPHIPVSEAINKFEGAMIIIACLVYYDWPRLSRIDI